MTTTEITLMILMGMWFIGFIILAISCDKMFRQRNEEREEKEKYRQSELNARRKYADLLGAFNKIREQKEELERKYNLEKDMESDENFIQSNDN